MNRNDWWSRLIMSLIVPRQLNAKVFLCAGNRFQRNCITLWSHPNALDVARAGRIVPFCHRRFPLANAMLLGSQLCQSWAYNAVVNVRCKCAINCAILCICQRHNASKHNRRGNNCKSAAHILGTISIWFIVDLTLQAKRQWKKHDVKRAMTLIRLNKEICISWGDNAQVINDCTLRETCNLCNGNVTSNPALWAQRLKKQQHSIATRQL